MITRISISTREVERQINHASNVVSDFSFVWDAVIKRLLQPQIRRQFGSNGRGRWPPRRDNLPHPLLRKTRRMFNSLTNSGHPDNVDQRTPSTLTYGTSVPYAIFHERRDIATRIPQRAFLEPIAEDRRFQEELAELIDLELSRQIRRR